MGAAREIRRRANVEALVLEALNGIATPEARDDIIERALEAAGRRRLPDGAKELVVFVSGPLRSAATEVLGEHEASELTEQLLYLLGRAVQSSVVQSSGPAPSEVNRTLPPPSSGVEKAKREGNKRSAVERRVSPPFMRAQEPSPKAKRTRTAAYANGMLTAKSSAPKVVLLDDDPNYRRALTRLLTSSGYEVASAPDAKTALWMCERLSPDVVVTDYELEDTDGLAFAAELTRRFGEDTPPVLLVTASTTLPICTGDIAAAMLKGTDDAALLAKVAELVALRAQKTG